MVEKVVEIEYIKLPGASGHTQRLQILRREGGVLKGGYSSSRVYDERSLAPTFVKLPTPVSVSTREDICLSPAASGGQIYVAEKADAWYDKRKPWQTLLGTFMRGKIDWKDYATKGVNAKTRFQEGDDGGIEFLVNGKKLPL